MAAEKFGIHKATTVGRLWRGWLKKHESSDGQLWDVTSGKTNCGRRPKWNPDKIADAIKDLDCNDHTTYSGYCAVSLDT